jgi:uncharacterized protein YutE (UPF0331/DUF86 family)
MVDQAIFLRRLDALRAYLDSVKTFQRTARDEFAREPAIHHLAERYLHLMMEAVLDLGNHYLADKDLGPADSNREVFDLLAHAGEIDPDLAVALGQWAGFRNILVHDYLRIDHGMAWDAIQRDLGSIERFCAWAASKV